MLNQKQKEYFAFMEELFSTQGWKMFIDDMTENRDALKAGVFGTREANDFFVSKGRYMTFEQVLNYQALVEDTRTQIELEDSSDPGI